MTLMEDEENNVKIIMKKYNIHYNKIMSKQNTNTNQSNSIGKIINKEIYIYLFLS